MLALIIISKSKLNITNITGSAIACFAGAGLTLAGFDGCGLSLSRLHYYKALKIKII